MNLKLEPEKFDELQVMFIKEIIERIKLKLQEEGFKGFELENITASIAFSIASTIDGTSRIEVDGVEVNPYLTFNINDDEIIHSGENPFMYEYVTGILKKLFPD